LPTRNTPRRAGDLDNFGLLEEAIKNRGDRRKQRPTTGSSPRFGRPLSQKASPPLVAIRSVLLVKDSIGELIEEYCEQDTEAALAEARNCRIDLLSGFHPSSGCLPKRFARQECLSRRAMLPGPPPRPVNHRRHLATVPHLWP